MPIPKPRAGETEDKFVSRCMGDSVMLSDYPDEKQRSAICYSQLEEKAMATPNYTDENKEQFMFRCMRDKDMVSQYPEDPDREKACTSQWNKEIKMDKSIWDTLGDFGSWIINKFRKDIGAVDYIDIDTVETLLDEELKQATRSEGGTLFRASDYAVVPDKEKPSTWKLRLAQSSSGDFTVTQIGAAITAMQPGGFRGNRVELEPGDKKQAIQRINAAISKCDGDETQKENLRKRLNRVKDIGTFHITKDKNGDMRWIGFPTNKYRDRDNPPQIISEKAHKDFVEHLNKSEDYPILLGWHTPGTRLGVADFADYVDGFLIMGGPIDKDKQEEAIKLADKAMEEQIGMSHGFVYKYGDKENEVIDWYRSWEVSHLPTAKAANVWTAIDVLKKEVEEMPMTDERKEYLSGIYGKDTIDKVLNKVDDLNKDLASMNIEYKEVVPEDSLQVDSEEAKEKAVQAIIENEGFKAMVASVLQLSEQMKELVETTIPSMQAKLDTTEKTAVEAEAKAQKSIDDIVSDAFKPKAKAQGYQASVKNEGPSEEEKKKEGLTEPSSPVDEGLMSLFLNTMKTPAPIPE